MLCTLVGAALAALAIAQFYGDVLLASVCGAAAVAVGALVFWGCRGTPISCAVLTLSNVALVILHIQLGRGTIEFHFGVFVLLGLLMVYQNWRPVVLTAVAFVVHHFLFDRLQAWGFGFYCTTDPGILKQVMHGIYVATQTGVEIYVLVRLRLATLEGAELSALVRRIDQPQRLHLDVSGIDVASPTAVMLKSVIGKMNAAMNEVDRVAGSIKASSFEIASGNVDLNQRTEEQASSLQQTAASMEELTTTVRKSAETAGTANALAGSASSAAVDGGNAVNKVVTTMTDISESSRRIADIISVIDGIAFQTNILALNAAVEAARAGEEGRGFAVVAAEVRQLAQRSATAAKEIKTLVGDSVSRVDAGMQLVGEAGTTMGTIVEQAKRVSELIGEMASHADHQAAGMTQVGQAVSQLDVMTQQNASLVEQSSAAAESLKDQALRLNEVVERFALSGTVATH
ncbi:hypothetical protein BH10PSE17_BH10PSE17_19900 [soil metagenome]